MARRYTYSRGIVTFRGKETFTAVEFDSFDEAIGAVDKGIYDRELSLKTAVNAVPTVDSGKPYVPEVIETIAETKTSNPIIRKSSI